MMVIRERPASTFRDVTLPLSMPGVVAGDVVGGEAVVDEQGGAFLGDAHAMLQTLGVGFLSSASSAEDAAESAESLQQYADLTAKAKRHDKIGSVALWSGAAFVGAGIAWYVLGSRDTTESQSLIGWVSNRSAGVALTGSF